MGFDARGDPNYTRILAAQGILSVPARLGNGRKAGGNSSKERQIHPKERQNFRPILNGVQSTWAEYWMSIGNFSSANMMDSNGWTPLHHACDATTYSERAGLAAEQSIRMTTKDLTRQHKGLSQEDGILST